jgi:hypothetical protein
MVKLSSVSVYDLQDEVVYSKSNGNLNQEKSDSSFNTSLDLSFGEGSLTEGESYYAVGLGEDNSPIRTEMIKCVVAGNSPTFEGSIIFPQKPQNAGQKGTLKAASEADMLIQYTNYSSTQFDRSTWGSNLQEGFGGLTNSPGPTLMANSGQQSIGASQNLSILDEGPADIFLCWSKGINFGIWIHFNFQFVGQGFRPIWYVSTNGSAWRLAGSDPSVPYTWDPLAVGFDIVATPTSGHNSLSVNAIITDIK